MDIQVRLPTFEGPFDLLFHLIEQEEVSIWDIPIARITEQYLAHIASLQELDLEIAGDFLVMAATLLSIKARMLLPQPVPEESAEEQAIDPRRELVERLLEYRRFKDAAAVLSGMMSGRDRLWPRGYSPPPMEILPRFSNPVGQATSADLRKAMTVVLTAYRPPPALAVVPRRQLTVDERVNDIEAVLRRRPVRSFSSLLSDRPTRQEVVVTFLALLELIRRGHCCAAQERPFGPIQLTQDEGIPRG